MDITNTSFKDNTFDCILCSYVLEHVGDDRRAMRELYRVMKLNGFGIFQVPIKRKTTYENHSIITPEQRLRRFGQQDHIRIYGKDFKDRLEDSGFIVKVDSYLDELDIKTINYYQLVPEGKNKEDIYICFKPRIEKFKIS